MRKETPQSKQFLEEVLILETGLPANKEIDKNLHRAVYLVIATDTFKTKGSLYETRSPTVN